MRCAGTLAAACATCTSLPREVYPRPRGVVLQKSAAPGPVPLTARTLVCHSGRRSELDGDAEGVIGGSAAAHRSVALIQTGVTQLYPLLYDMCDFYGGTTQCLAGRRMWQKSAVPGPVSLTARALLCHSGRHDELVRSAEGVSCGFASAHLYVAPVWTGALRACPLLYGVCDFYGSTTQVYPRHVAEERCTGRCAPHGLWVLQSLGTPLWARWRRGGRD